MIPWIRHLSVRLGISTNRTDSQNQSQKAKASQGGTVNQTNNFYNGGSPEPAPDIFVQIYGDGSMKMFRTHVDNRSGRMLTVDTITLNGEVTILNQAVSGRGGFSTDDVKFPTALFTQPVDSLMVEVQYHTLDDTDRKYRYVTRGRQVSRVAGGFNIEFPEPPVIKQLT